MIMMILMHELQRPLVLELWGEAGWESGDEECLDFPDALLACTRLQRLHLDFRDNYMTCFELTAGIGMLQHLQSLQLLGCGVHELPESMGWLTQLTRLVIRNERNGRAWRNDVLVPHGLLEEIEVVDMNHAY